MKTIALMTSFYFILGDEVYAMTNIDAYNYDLTVNIPQYHLDRPARAGRASNFGKIPNDVGGLIIGRREVSEEPEHTDNWKLAAVDFLRANGLEILKSCCQNLVAERIDSVISEFKGKWKYAMICKGRQ
ncbi:MAG: hypothetical protein LBO02_01835 [Holosporaceae bacterium]|jgi:hypothetical protein|nr:hypothetical protein [Holosporaceae bacterium]